MNSMTQREALALFMPVLSLLSTIILALLIYIWRQMLRELRSIGSQLNALDHCVDTRFEVEHRESEARHLRTTERLVVLETTLKIALHQPHPEGDRPSD